MQTFWIKLKSNLRINIFDDYDFVFSLSDYFLISPFRDFSFFPSTEGIGKKADVPIIWYFLISLFYRDTCLFYCKEDDIYQFYKGFLSGFSPLVFNKIEQSFFLGIKKYERDLYNFIYKNKRNFNKDAFRFMWLVYKDKFDVEFLRRNINNPLFLFWYIENMRKDTREKTIEKELDMYITNPEMFTEMRKRGIFSDTADEGEREDFIDTVQKMAQMHKEYIEEERKKKKRKENRK